MQKKLIFLLIITCTLMIPLSTHANLIGDYVDINDFGTVTSGIEVEDGIIEFNTSYTDEEVSIDLEEYTIGFTFSDGSGFWVTEGRSGWSFDFTISSLDVSDFPSGILGFTETGSLFGVVPTTNLLSPTSIRVRLSQGMIIGQNNFDLNYYEITLSPEPIPEPATMLLLGTGLVGVAGAARRRKKKQA